MPFGTTTFEISPSPVRAVIVTHEVMSVPAFVMKIFEPSTTQLAVVEPAVVRVAPASEPAPGSVSPNAASFRPEARSGSQRALLLLVAEEEDRHRPERGVRGDGDRDGRVDPRQLLDRDRVREGVAAGAAVLLGNRDPHQAELGQLGDELVREAALAVELLREGRDALARELATVVAHQLVLGREGRGSPGGAMLPDATLAAFDRPVNH